MVDSIAKTLGAGSGIDVTALVTSLVEAQFSVKTQQFTSRAETLTSQISTVSQLKSGITGFASALASLVKGGSLATAATSSNDSIVKASTLPGAQIKALNSTIEVRALASAQVAATNVARTAGATIGTGSIKIQFGSKDDNGVFQPDATDIPAIDIATAEEATLSGIAAKINAATPPTGLTVSVITDAGGERLVLKGASGAARAFTVTATDTGTPGLAAAVNVGAGAAGTTIASAATDAKVAVDGVEVRRATNSIDDLIPGVRLDLRSAQIGTRVSLGATPATAALTQAVNDVVTTYNELYNVLKEATDPVTGKLARDSGALEMKRQLKAMTLTDLTGASDGSPKSLAELGVATNRDGTLSVDSARLAKSLAANPGAVEAMFTDRGTGATGKGLSAALNAVSTAVTSRTFGIGASEQRYTKAQSALTNDKLKVTEAQAKLKDRLTQQYSTMDARVAAYKATQTFLTQQVDAWNSN
ncbi:MAG: flagellar filament capping protein FliD [Pseudomonadota bacterium]